MDDDELLRHIHEDIVRLERTVEHGVAGIGLILGYLSPDNLTIHDDHVEIRIPRAQQLEGNDFVSMLKDAVNDH